MEGVSGIPKRKIHSILTEYLTKKYIVAWWVPHILFPVQKHCRMELRQKNLTHYKKVGIVFLQRINTSDETWVRDFNPELKF